MAKRKKLNRFEVFKRDGFQCQYCGGHPPEKTLEVDHVVPLCKGGSDDLHNLITSCFDCNRGKGKHELGVAPIPLSLHMNTIKERERQYQEYRKLLSKINQRINDEINQVEAIFIHRTNSCFSDTFRISVKKFINALPLEEVKEAMTIALGKGMDPNNTARYFCGICWNKIRDIDG